MYHVHVWFGFRRKQIKLNLKLKNLLWMKATVVQVMLTIMQSYHLLADLVRSIKRPIIKDGPSNAKHSKCRKESPDDVLLMKALQCMERSTDNIVQIKDPDEVFGQYIATELRGIQDKNRKQLIKYRIQSVLFTALAPENHLYYPHSQAIPSWQAAPFSTTQAIRLWQSSGSPTPSERSHNAGRVSNPPFSPTNTVVTSSAYD